MEQNLRTSLGREQSRLKAFANAFEKSIYRVQNFIESAQEVPSNTVSVFAYAFGMRSGDVCDLLSLMKVASGVITPDEIERLKQQYSGEIERRYSGGSGLGGLEALARNYGFGSMVESVKRGIRADAEVEVKNRIIGEIQRRLDDRLTSVGETTLDIEQLASLWKGDSPGWENAEHLVFGNTPMCGALKRMTARFKSELGRRASAKPASILLLVSDGEPTDGDPIPLGAELRELGVTSVCCYITDRDVMTTKTLVNDFDANWPKGARVMFDLASTIPDDSPITHFLLRNGWTVSSNARTFVQANHSEVLEQLVGMAMSPVEQGYALLPKGT
jgi:hypothetical protein